MIFIWPFLLGLGKVLLPNLIRTAVPMVATWAVQKLGGGPPQGPQTAAYYDDEVLDDEEYEDEDDEEYEDE